MDFRVKDGVLEAVRFCGHGCSISQAAASMLCEHVEGRPLEEVKKLAREDVLEMLGIELGPGAAQVRAAGAEDAQGRHLRREPVARRGRGRSAVNDRAIRDRGARRRDPAGRAQDRARRGRAASRCSTWRTATTPSRTSARTTAARSPRASCDGESSNVPRHGAQFDVRTGAVAARCPAMSPVPTYRRARRGRRNPGGVVMSDETKAALNPHTGQPWPADPADSASAAAPARRLRRHSAGPTPDAPPQTGPPQWSSMPSQQELAVRSVARDRDGPRDPACR